MKTREKHVQKGGRQGCFQKNMRLFRCKPQGGGFLPLVGMTAAEEHKAESIVFTSQYTAIFYVVMGIDMAMGVRGDSQRGRYSTLSNPSNARRQAARTAGVSRASMFSGPRRRRSRVDLRRVRRSKALAPFGP